ncbi:hypothetical protein BGX27_007947 [Mortierella sp. AM989]|nr:hypothetical protein BGX27_007947 [Mortierella sp. AM989]
MKSSTTTLVAFLASSLPLLSSTADAFVYPATPVGATVWRPNSNVTITWTDDNTAPTLASKPVFDIFLMTGADDHQIKLETIATNVKGGATDSVNYKVPYVSPPGQIYFLMFQTKDLSTTAWATRFTITDAGGNPGNLKPVIPVGGKINPGGVGTIISAVEAKAEAKQNKKKKSSKPKSKATPEIEETNGGGKSRASPEEASSGDSPGSSPSSSTSASSDANSENHVSHESPLGAESGVTLKTPVTSGGNSEPALVDVGVHVNKGKMSVHSGAVATTAVAASSTAMVAFVGFAVLMGF